MKFIQTIDTINFTGLQGVIWDLITLHDGKRFITSSSDGAIRIWDIHSGNILKTIYDLGSHLNITPDDKFLIFGMQNGFIKIIDINSEEIIQNIEAHRSFLLDLKIHPEGTHFISASIDKTVKIFNIESGVCEQTIETGDFEVWSIDITPNGKEFLLGKDNGKIEIWDFKSTKKIREFFGHKKTVKAKITPNGIQIVSRGINSAIKIWNFEDNELITELPGKSSSRFVFSHDGNKFAYVNWIYERNRPPNTPQSGSFFEIWNTQTWELIKYIKIEEREKIDKIIFTNDGNQLITANRRGNLKRWDITESKPKCVVESKNASVYSAYNTLDGKRLITIHMNGFVKIWDIDSAECIKSFELGIYMEYTHLYFAMQLTSDGKRLVYGDYRGIIKIWDVENGILLNEIKAHATKISAINISDNDKIIISHALKSSKWTDDGNQKTFKRELKVWDLEKGEYLKEIKRPKCPKLSKYFIIANKENQLRSIGYQDVVKVINTKSKKFSRGFNYSSRDCVKITDDGMQLIIGKKKGFLKIYDVKTGKKLNYIKAHDDDIHDIKNLSERNLLITSDCRGAIKIWNFSSMTCLKSYNITRNDREDFVTTMDNEKLIFIRQINNGKHISNEIQVYNLNTNSLLNKIQIDTSIYSFLVSPKGDKIIGLVKEKNIPLNERKSRSLNLMLKFWDINSGDLLLQVKPPKDIGLEISGISYDEKKIIYKSSSDIVKIWNLEEKKILYTIKGYLVRIVNTPKVDKLFVDLLHGNYYSWDINTGKRLKSFKTPKDFVSTKDVSADGKFSVASTEIPVIHIYDLESEEVLYKIKLPYPTMPIPSPDGNSFIILESKNPIKVWDLQTGTILKTLKNKKSGSKYALTPDGKNIIISTSETTLEVWNLDKEKKNADLDNETIISNVWASYSYILVGNRQGNIKIWKID